MRLSQSEAAAFKRCRRKWYNNYYRALLPAVERVTGTSAIGNRVHDALARYYGHGDDPVAVLKAGLSRDLAAQPTREQDLLKDGDLCVAMVEGYLQWLEETGADEDYEVLGAEQEVSQEFPAVPGVTLVGKMDLRVRRRSDGARLFLDHKTVSSLTDIPRTAQITEQFLHYGLLERLVSPQTAEQWCDGGVYNMLKRSKRTARAAPPFFERYEVRHNDTALRGYYVRLSAVARDILSVRERLDGGESFQTACYPSPDGKCSWDCQFLTICPMFDDGSDVESVVRVAYRVGDPYERYTTTEVSE